MTPTDPPIDTTDQPTDTPTQSALDLVDIETVHENGIIETPTAYAMVVEIEPRDWLTLSEKQRSDLYTKFLTYLRGLDFPTHFLTLTTRFDADQYYDQIVGAEAPTAPTDTPPATSPQTTPDSRGSGGPQNGASAADATRPASSNSDRARQRDEEEATAPHQEAEPATSDTPAPDGGEPTTGGNLVVESPLLEYGRHAHVGWLRSVISDGEVRDRRFFVAVGVPKGDDCGGPIRSQLAAIRDLFPGGESDARVTNEDAYLDEVWTRAQQVAAKLPRTDVGTTVIDSRNAVLEILYHYYRGQKAPISFDHGTLTRPDQTGLVDPDTGEALDLDEAVAEADRHAESDPEPEDLPDRPTDDPFDGRVATEFVDRVDGSRLLSWYVRHIGPIGTSTRAVTPRAVYAGVLGFVGSLLLAGTALGAFLASARPDLVVSRSPTFWLVREAAYGLAAASLPLFLGSLVGLLPTDWRARATSLLGTGITGGAIYLFAEAYPVRWTADMAVTTRAVKIYAVGLGLLVIAVALAIAARRAALTDIATPTESTGEPLPDGGTVADNQDKSADIALWATDTPAVVEEPCERTTHHELE